MSDYDSSLPTRTESAGDIDVFLSDSVTPSQKLKVNADGSIDVNSTATDLDIRDLVFATDKVDVSGSDITATVSATQLDVDDLTFADDKVDVTGSDVTATVTATDLDIRDLVAATDSVQANLFDEAGVAYSSSNPLPVEFTSDQAGDEIVSYNTSATVAAAASVNHDYTVTVAKTLICDSIFASGSGKIKVEVLVNAVAKFTGFNSTSNPNIEIPMGKILKGGATEVVRITITNRDKQPQDVYSTLSGLEV